jgi:hypothetical protein
MKKPTPEIPKIRKIRRTPKARPKDKCKWAVFNIETRFRLTEYTTRGLAELARRNILFDQPELKKKIAIKQRSFEVD